MMSLEKCLPFSIFYIFLLINWSLFPVKLLSLFNSRYGWDDPYEYDETGAGYYEGWYQDPDTGAWKLEPAVREYYERLGIGTLETWQNIFRYWANIFAAIPEPGEADPDNNTSGRGGASNKVDNSSVAGNKNSVVSDLNKKNSASAGSSDSYTIPYGDRTQPSSDIINTPARGKDHATKTMHNMLQGKQ